MKEFNDSLKEGMIAFDKTLKNREKEMEDKLKGNIYIRMFLKI